MMQPSLIGGSSGGATSGALVRKRVLTVNGGQPFLRITESLDLGSWPDTWLALVQADYGGPLVLTKDIVQADIFFVGGGGGGALSPDPAVYGGFPGGTYRFQSTLADMKEQFYLFVGAGGPGAHIPDPEQEWDDGAARPGSSSQFYNYSQYTFNDPQAVGGYQGSASEPEMRSFWQEMLAFADLRTPDPTTSSFSGLYGNQNGPGQGGSIKASSSHLGGYAYAADPLRQVQSGFGEGENGQDGPDNRFGACGSGGCTNRTGTGDGGNGGTPGGGGGACNNMVDGRGGDGGRGEIQIQFSLLEVA